MAERSTVYDDTVFPLQVAGYDALVLQTSFITMILAKFGWGTNQWRK